MTEESEIIDLSDQRQKRSLLARIGAAQGAYEVTLKPYKPRRSNRANAWYWASVIGAFVQFCREQGENRSPEECHLILKMALLPPRKFANPQTGEEIAVPSDTHTMDTGEFSDFCERACAWLADFGVVVAPASEPCPSAQRKSA